MNKVLKGLVAVVSAAAMAIAGFAGASTAMAEGNGTIEITGKETGHTYNAYQVFSGDYSDGVLSNIKWGKNAASVSTQILADLQANSAFGEGTNNIFKDCVDAACVAKALSDRNYGDDSTQAQAFAKTVGDLVTGAPTASTANQKIYTISGLGYGYYIVKDAGDNDANKKDTVYSRYLAKVVGDAKVTINTKESKPTLDKQIKHNETENWEVVGDNQIGDTVKFRTITTVPDTTGYTSYDYEINDTMSEGLTSNVKTAKDVTIKVNDDKDNALSADYYTVAVDTQNSNKFTIRVDVLKAVQDDKMVAGDVLYSYYTAILNKNAMSYDEGRQDNTAYLVYSNNPNNTVDKGETPHKTVYDWTFKMSVNKVAEDGTNLPGAKFVLSKKSGQNNTDDTITANGSWTNTDSLIALIKDDATNTYTVAPTGYTGVTTFVIDTDNPKIKGLDDDTDYYLYETASPAKYNRKVEPTMFRIASAYSGDGSSVAEGYPTLAVDAADANPSMIAKIVNKKGSSLPSTGGMGTTILYVAGAAIVLVAAFGIAFAVRRRNAR